MNAVSREPLRRAWAEGRVAFNYWAATPSISSLRALVGTGYDSILIDMQHTPLELADVYTLLSSMDPGIGTSLVRVPWNDPIHIQRLLDFGAGGIVCPMVNSRAEAEQFVSFCRYPPEGRRSFGPFRAADAYGGRPAYFAAANDDIVTIAQIETIEALDRVEEIVATPGLDALMIGPGDLSITAGLGPVIDYSDSRVAEWHRRVADAAHRAGKRVMMLALDPTPAEISEVAGWGADLISLSNDLGMLRASALEAIATARGAVAGSSPNN